MRITMINAMNTTKQTDIFLNKLNSTEINTFYTQRGNLYVKTSSPEIKLYCFF